MRGTEKQQIWAKQIKNSFTEAMEKLATLQKDGVLPEQAQKVVDYLLGVESAQFWIDHKNTAEQGSGLLRIICTSGCEIDGQIVKFNPVTGEVA